MWQGQWQHGGALGPRPAMGWYNFDFFVRCRTFHKHVQHGRSYGAWQHRSLALRDNRTEFRQRRTECCKQMFLCCQSRVPTDWCSRLFAICISCTRLHVASAFLHDRWLVQGQYDGPAAKCWGTWHVCDNGAYTGHTRGASGAGYDERAGDTRWGNWVSCADRIHNLDCFQLILPPSTFPLATSEMWPTIIMHHFYRCKCELNSTTTTSDCSRSVAISLWQMGR